MPFRRIKLIAIVTGIYFLNACDLHRYPESDLSNAVYWQTPSDFYQAANYLYQAAFISTSNREYILRADIMSDNAYGSAPDNVSNGSYLPSANFGPWDQNYALIRAANNILGKAEETDLLPEEIAEYVGEAHFFRAYAYADLLRRYGEVPVITKTLDTEDEELYAPRMSRDLVTELIYQDLDLAVEHLMPAIDLQGIRQNNSRVKKGAALTLKSRVALYEGTRGKFNGLPGYQDHLQIALSASKAVIESGEYELFHQFGVDSYHLLFKAQGEGLTNTEAIWTRIFGFDNDNDVNGVNFAQQMSNGEIGATRSLVDSYLCTDGLPIDQSPLYQGRINVSSDYMNRDPRLDGTIVKPGDLYFAQNVEYIPQIVSQTGYHIEKYFDNSNRRYLDHIIFRYAEVLLNYAEAVFELNDAISDADLDISINLLRDRVALPHLTNSFISEHGLDMREEIRRERRVELAMEGFRYDDLLRWKTAEIELPKPILGVRFFNAEYPANDPSTLQLTADSIVIVEPADKRQFDPARQYLWPLPLNQLALNSNLTQNPNW